MSTYKRGNIWWVQIRKKPFGEIRQSSGSTSRKVARALEAKIRAELESKRVDQLLGRPVSHKFDDALIMWLETAPPQSWYPKIRLIRPYFEGTMLHDAVAHANRMRADMIKNKASPCHINRCLAAVKRCLNLAYKEFGLLEQPLAQKIRMESEGATKREIYLSKEQFNAIFDHIQPTRKHADYRATKAAILLLVMTGLRKSELLRLKPEDWRQPVLSVINGKGNKTRAVPVHPSCFELCDEYLPFDVSEHQLRYWWDKGRNGAGLPDIRMHDLRHTFASWYADDPSATMIQLQHILGHSNLAVTSRYAHLLDGNVTPDSVGDGVNTTIH